MAILQFVLHTLALCRIISVTANSFQRRDCTITWVAYDSDTCYYLADAWSITEAQFVSYNPGVICSSLVIGKEYCVEWAGALPTPTPTSQPTTFKTSKSTKPTLTPANIMLWFSAITPKPSPTPTPGPTKPAPTQPNVDAKCNKWYFVVNKDTCEVVVNQNKISLNDFYKWNPDVGSTCSYLWLDTYVRIGAA